MTSLAQTLLEGSVGIPIPEDLKALQTQTSAVLTVLTEEQAASKDKKKKKEKEVIPEGPKGMVLYVDGSTRPNPGFGGWGLHGYLYEAVEPKKGTGNASEVLTRVGYVPKAQAKKPAIDPITGETAAPVKEIKPLNYFDGWGSFHVPVTNNYSELTGLSHGLKLAGEHPIKYVTIHSDSMYVVEGLNRLLPVWKHNNWIRSRDGAPVANKHMWLDTESHLNALKAKGIRVNVRWIKGHATHYGNQIADKNARFGSNKAMEGEAAVCILTEDADGYFTYKAEKHPFLFHRSMYFSTKEGSFTKGEYYLGEHGKDSDMIGTKSTDARFSAVILSEPDELIEKLRDHQISVAKGKEALVLARLDKLFNHGFAKDFKRFGSVALTQKKLSKLDLYGIEREAPADQVSIEDADQASEDQEPVKARMTYAQSDLPGTPITKELNPPLLAYRSLQSVNLLKGLLLMWKKHHDEQSENKHLGVTDITSLIYDQNDKGELSVKKDYSAGFTAVRVNAQWRDEKGAAKEHEITVDMGADMPDRNVFKRIEELTPKVMLITWLESETSFRYATIVTAGDDLGIWAAMYSNLRFTIDVKAFKKIKEKTATKSVEVKKK